MKTFKADLVLNAGAELAEGPLWHEEEQKLYWVNINVGELHRFDPVTGKRRIVFLRRADRNDSIAKKTAD